jgi:fatty acid/phospholipid biosynthesis enzyme
VSSIDATEIHAGEGCFSTWSRRNETMDNDSYRAGFVDGVSAAIVKAKSKSVREELRAIVHEVLERRASEILEDVRP